MKGRTDAISIVYTSSADREGEWRTLRIPTRQDVTSLVGSWSESDSLERARHCFLDNPLCEKQMNAVTPTIKRVLCLWKWCAFDAGDYELR